MDAGGWLELAAFLLGMGLLGALAAGEQALALRDPSAQAGPAPATGALAWLRRHPRRTGVALLLYQDLALVVLSVLLAGLLLRLVSSQGWAILLAVGITLALGFLAQLGGRQYVVRHAPSTARNLASPLRALVVAAYPVIWALRLLPDQRPGTGEAALEGGSALKEPVEPPGEPERRMIQSIIGLSQTTVREIMVPRLDMVAVEESMPLDEVAQVIRRQGYSRLPVYRETADHIVGVIHVKDLWPHLGQGQPPPLARIARPPHFIPESKRIDECLEEFLKKRVHMAIVVDEYGGVAGLVTMEDVIEEIVGEISDEYSREEPHIRRLSEDEALIDGRVSISDVNEALGLDLPSEGFDTIGGLVLTHLGHIPTPGETLEVPGVQLSVISTLGRRIRQVRLVKKGAEEPAASQSGETRAE